MSKLRLSAKSKEEEYVDNSDGGGNSEKFQWQETTDVLHPTMHLCGVFMSRYKVLMKIM